MADVQAHPVQRHVVSVPYAAAPPLQGFHHTALQVAIPPPRHHPQLPHRPPGYQDYG